MGGSVGRFAETHGIKLPQPHQPYFCPTHSKGRVGHPNRPLAKPLLNKGKNGAGERSRTPDLRITNTAVLAAGRYK